MSIIFKRCIKCGARPGKCSCTIEMGPPPKPIKVKSTIMNKVTLFILTTLTLTSCGKFSDGTSVWAEGLWIIPVLMFLGGAWFLYLAYRASKSNSTQQVPGGTKDNTGNVPIYKVGKFWIGIALVVLTIIVMLHQSAQK